MVVRVPDRERVQKLLAGRGVQTGVHYPVPCHQQPPLMRYATTPLPVCERAAREQFSLPLFPHMTTEQLEYTCAAVAEALDEVVGR
jgi:dTDP-4-amino-4,6-dideoxygalactose transaminase